MSKDPNYTQCIACQHNLHYTDIDEWATIDLPFCPNELCVRYGLLTMPDNLLLADKVDGYKELE